MYFQSPFPNREMTRRSFCNGVLISSTAFALAGSVKQNEARPGLTVAYPPMKIEGAERLMPDSFLYFSYPANTPAVLIRTTEGQYFAYGRKCGHRGCSVEFSVARRCLVCPCHQGAYDARTGFVLFGPPPRPLDPIVLEMRAGNEIWAVGKSIGDTSTHA